jgi:hypothetical protein
VYHWIRLTTAAAGGEARHFGTGEKVMGEPLEPAPAAYTRRRVPASTADVGAVAFLGCQRDCDPSERQVIDVNQTYTVEASRLHVLFERFFRRWNRSASAASPTLTTIISALTRSK